MVMMMTSAECGEWRVFCATGSYVPSSLGSKGVRETLRTER